MSSVGACAILRLSAKTTDRLRAPFCTINCFSTSILGLDELRSTTIQPARLTSLPTVSVHALSVVFTWIGRFFKVGSVSSHRKPKERDSNFARGRHARQ